VELHRLALQALLVYLILFGLIRASGKRTLAQATSFDFVLTLILGELTGHALYGEVSVARFAAAAVAIVTAHLALSWASSRSERVCRLVDGSATLVVEDGEPVREGLRGERMSEKDLAFEVRHDGIDREDWPEIRAARVECSGAVSVLRHGWARPAMRKDAEAVRRAMRRGGRRPG
jgi:uncharacterized membrane protein YcaP (DUF421 family)